MFATASMLQFSIASAFLQYQCDLSRFCSWSQIRPMAIYSLGSKGCSFLASSRMATERSTLSCFWYILERQRKDSMLLLWRTEERNCLSASLRKLRWQQHFPRATFHHASSQLFSSVAKTANQRHFFKLCSTQNMYWKISLDFERRCATFLRSTFELSNKFYPYCSREAVASLSTLPLEVVGTPPLVMMRPVRSIPFPCLDPLLEALVPTLWNPVVILPVVVGRRRGLAAFVFLKEVPARAKRLFSSSFIIISAMPSSSVSSSSTQFSFIRHWHLSIQAASSLPFFQSSWSHTSMACPNFRLWQREWARMKSIYYDQSDCTEGKGLAEGERVVREQQGGVDDDERKDRSNEGDSHEDHSACLFSVVHPGQRACFLLHQRNVGEGVR